MVLMSDLTDMYAKPPDFSGIQQGSQAGLQMGIEMASRQSSLAMQQQELQFRRTQLEQQKMEHMTTLADAAFKEDDPTVRQIKFNQLQTVGNNIGYPISDDSIGLMQKSDKIRQNWLASLPYRNLMDPQTRAQANQDGVGAMVGGPLKVAEYLDKMTDQQAKQQNFETLATGKINAAAMSGTQARLKELLPYASSPEDAQILTDPSNPEWLEAYGRAARIMATRKETQQSDTSANVNSQIDTREGNLDEKTRHNKVTEQTAQQRVGLAMEAMKMRGKSLTLAQQHLLEHQADGADKITSKYDGMSQLADNGLDRLKTGMKWIDLSDTTADYNRLITGNNRASFQGEDRKTFTDFKASYDKIMGKINGNEQGGPTDAEIGLFRDRFEAMKDVAARYSDNVSKRYWQSRVSTKLTDPDVAQTYWETNKKAENSTWNMKAGSPAITNQTKPNLINPNPGSVPPAPGTGAQLRTPSVIILNAAKAKIPDLTARKNWLKSKGYDTTGVQ